MNVPLCSDTAPMASAEGTWTTFRTAALQAGLSQHREWRAPSSRAHWAGSRRSRKEKEKEVATGPGAEEGFLAVVLESPSWKRGFPREGTPPAPAQAHEQGDGHHTEA